MTLLQWLDISIILLWLRHHMINIAMKVPSWISSFHFFDPVVAMILGTKEPVSKTEASGVFTILLRFAFFIKSLQASLQSLLVVCGQFWKCLRSCTSQCLILSRENHGYRYICECLPFRCDRYR